MLHDLETGCETVKYVDDTTEYHESDVGGKSVQVGSCDTTDWPHANDVHLNATKTNEMLISFVFVNLFLLGHAPMSVVL